MQSVNADQNLNTDDNHHQLSFYIFLILIFILIGRPQDSLSFLRPFRLALLFTLLAFISTFINKHNSFRKILDINESIKYVLFFLRMIFGIPFAIHRGNSFNYIFTKYLSNILFFCIFVVQVTSIKKLEKVLFVLCLSVFLYSIFTMATGSFSDETWHHARYFEAGTMFDPNDMAYFFVSMLPLVFYFVLRKPLYKKNIAVISVIVSFYIILLSGSRGGFLGLATVFILIAFTKLGGLKVSHKIILVVFLIIGSAYYGHNIDMDRYLTMTNIEDDYNVTDESGRLSIWKRGFQMTLSHPITGVGVNCFHIGIGYQREAEGEIPKWQAPHNSYVQVLAETGIIGFFVFMSLIFNCIKNFHYLSRDKLISDGAPHPYTYIAGLFKVGFLGSLVCAFFLSQAYSIFFTLYFALSAVLRHLSNIEREKLTELKSIT